jgi:hypothetical protein
MAVAKIGGFRTVLGRHLTQGPLKSLSLRTTFQADAHTLAASPQSGGSSQNAQGCLAGMRRTADPSCQNGYQHLQ